MSIYDNAGVVLIPSGYKAGTTDNLYSVVPANGDGDFNATRGSSATRVNKDGFIESVATNVPRLDYPLIDGVPQDCPNLLLEPSTTNLTNYSTQIDNSFWSKSNSSVSANSGISPNGNLEADKIVENTSSGVSHGLTKSITAPSSTTSTLSLFAKADGRNLIRVQFSTSIRAFFNISNGSIGTVNSGTTAKIEKFPNDWYRCSITGTSSSGATTFTQILPALDDEDVTYDGDGTSGFLLWGIQFESKSYATSFIETVASTTSRSADVCNSSGTSAEFNDSEGVLFSEMSALANDGTIRRIAIPNSGATALNRIEFSSTNNKVFGVTYVSPSNQAAISYTMPDATTPFKMAYKYKENDFALWVDGFERGTDSSGSLPTGLTKLNFDNGAGGNDFYGKTKQLMTFKKALTDSELETLTSHDTFNAMAKSQLYTIE